MTDSELQLARLQKWHLDGATVRTAEQGAAFLESVGFCLLLPMRPAVAVPTFIGAWVGADENLPTYQHAYADQRATDASELMVRLLRQRVAYEANLFDENNAFLVAASVFPFFYALVGERNPKQAPKGGPRSEYTQLACDAFDVIHREGPISKPKLAQTLGGGVSPAALDHALQQLWSRLRITRVDYKAGEGSYWDVLYRWAPEAVQEGMGLSIGESLSALVSRYLDCMVAAEQDDVENFFSHFVSRSRVREAIHALIAARELSFAHVGSRSLLQVAQTRAEPAPVVRRNSPIARRHPRPASKT